MSHPDGKVRVEHRQDGWVVTLALSEDGRAKLAAGHRVQFAQCDDREVFDHTVKEGPSGNRLFPVKELVVEPPYPGR